MGIIVMTASLLLTVSMPASAGGGDITFTASELFLAEDIHFNVNVPATVAQFSYNTAGSNLRITSIGIEQSSGENFVSAVYLTDQADNVIASKAYGLDSTTYSFVGHDFGDSKISFDTTPYSSGELYLKIKAYGSSPITSRWRISKIEGVNVDTGDAINISNYDMLWGPQFTITSLPDLKADQINLSSDTYVAGVPVNIIGVVKNISSTAVGSRFDYQFLVNNTLVKSGDSVSLDSGSTANVVYNNWTPTSAGMYTIKFIVNPYSIVHESSETNNSVSKTITVTTASSSMTKPDLSPQDITISPNPPYSGGTNITFSSIVSNRGTATDEFYVQWYVDDVLKGNCQQPAVTANSSVSFGCSQFSWAATGGNHTIKIVVDSGNVVDESNENNNTKSASITVVGDQETERPNFTVTDMQLPATIDLSKSDLALVTAAIKNVGAPVAAYRVVSYINDVISSDFTYDQGLPLDERGVSYKENLLPQNFHNGQNVVKIQVFDPTGKEVSLDNNIATRTIVGVNGNGDNDYQTPSNQTTSLDESQLQTRIAKLNYQPSTSETQFVANEKQLVTKTDSTLANRLKGRILLQVQGNGEAWYVDPITAKKFYLKDGQSAYLALNAFGLGVANADLAKIPVGIEARFADVDTDNDGLPDKLEEGLGTDPNNPDTDGDSYLDGGEILSGHNPLGAGLISVDSGLVNQLRGKILLQVQSRGEAWYINPSDGKRYYLKNGEAAYQIMRFLSLGITNNDLRKIPVGSL